MLTLSVLRDALHFCPAWAFPVSITAKCDALGFLCLWPGRSKPSFKIYTGIWESWSSGSPLFELLPANYLIFFSSFPWGVEWLLLKEIPDFRLECLKNETSPKSLTWTQHFGFLSSKWKKQQVSLMLTSLRLLECCLAFKLNKSDSVAFYILSCVYIHWALAWHFVSKSNFCYILFQISYEKVGENITQSGNNSHFKPMCKTETQRKKEGKRK